MIEIATCSYGEYGPDMGYPIRTSTGAPKWFTYPYMSWENVFPSYSMLQMGYDDYLPRYLAMLDRHGPEKLRGDLEFISEEYAKANSGEVRPLALCCYEKLSKDGAWCHRTTADVAGGNRRRAQGRGGYRGDRVDDLLPIRTGSVSRRMSGSASSTTWTTTPTSPTPSCNWGFLIHGCSDEHG